MNPVRPALASLGLLLATACGGGISPAAQPKTAQPKTAQPNSKDPAVASLTVLAASSLTKVFTAEGAAYEKAHRGAHVSFSFAGSQTLVAQVAQGAPADVLATADTSSIATVTAELNGEPRVFARNRLAVITGAGNPRHLGTLADLAKPGVKVVLAGPTVPVGKAAAKALAAAGVRLAPVSLEQDVKGVVTKVRLGEADAGIAYVTDLKAANGSIAGTPLRGISNSYPAAILKASKAPDAAEAFIDFVLSPAGQSILAAAGFLPPA